jgi:hypothetical protein
LRQVLPMMRHVQSEKLDVYQMAVRFDALVCKLLPRLVSLRPAGEKRHFYGIARGSATECAAHLDGCETVV